MDKDQRHKLTCLIEEGEDLDEIRRIVENNPGTLTQDYGCGTWLQIAAADEHPAVVDLLLQLGSDVNQVCQYKGVSGGTTALTNAVIWGEIENCKLLLKNGAVPNDDVRVLIKAINSAPSDKVLDLVKLLHQYGSDIHRVYQNHQTGKLMNALSEAQGKPELVDYLTQNGCRLPDKSDGDPS